MAKFYNSDSLYVGNVAIFQLADGSILYVVKDGTVVHPVVLQEDPTYGSVMYVDKGLSDPFIVALRSLLKHDVGCYHVDTAFPMTVHNETFDINSYDSKTIVRDYHEALLVKGIVPWEWTTAPNPLTMYGFELSDEYEQTPIVAPKTADFSKWEDDTDYTTYWNEDEKANIQYHLDKYGDLQLPTDNKELMLLVKLFRLGMAKSALFFGPAATFKTYSAIIISVLLEIPCESMIIDSGTEPEQLLVSMQPVASGKGGLTIRERKRMDEYTQQLLSGELSPEQYTALTNAEFNLGISGAQFKNVYSVILQRFERGGMAIVDEMNMGSPSVFGSFNNMLDGTEKITTYEGRTIYRHPKFFFIACINPLYEDVQSMNEAMVSRFTNTVRFFDVSRDKFKEIVSNDIKYKNFSFLDKVYDFFTAMGVTATKERIPFRLTFREINTFVLQAVRLMDSGEMDRDTMRALVNTTMISKMTVNESDKKYNDLIRMTDKYITDFTSLINKVPKGSAKALGLKASQTTTSKDDYLRRLAGGN